MKCPWCGASGPNFDESPAPSDYCGHDPALVHGGGTDAQAAAAERGEHDALIREYDNRPENDVRDAASAALPDGAKHG